MDKSQVHRITTLIFDMGGVLIRLSMPRAAEAFARIGVYNTDHLIDNYVQTGVFQQLENGDITPDVFRNALRRQWGMPQLTDAAIDDALFHFLCGIPSEKLELLLRLRCHYRVFLLSNTNAIHFPWCEQHLFRYKQYTLNDFFDKTYLSYQMHLSKPHPDIFRALLADSGLQAHECYFLDDSPANVAAAQKLGFHVQLVDPDADLRQYVDFLL